jgi:hypothetical protein
MLFYWIFMKVRPWGGLWNGFLIISASSPAFRWDGFLFAWVSDFNFHANSLKGEIMRKGTGHRQTSIFCFWIILLSLVVWNSTALAVANLPLSGPERFDRLKGAPTVYTGSFDRCEPSDRAVLRVWNGENERTRITAAEIFVNGIEAAGENLLQKKTAYFEIPLSIGVRNDFRIVLKSGDFKEPAFLRIEFLGQGCDITPPVISDLHPLDGALLNTSRPQIAVSFADEEPGASGIDLASVRLLIDGRDVTAAAEPSAAGVTWHPTSGLTEGEHPVTVSVADIAGNRSEQSWTFTTDTVPPVIAIASHADGVWLNTPSVTISGSLTDERGELPAVRINGIAAAVTEGGFSLAGVPLGEGGNPIKVVVTDRAGNSSNTAIVIHLDTVAPVITAPSPTDGSLLNTARPALSASFADEPQGSGLDLASARFLLDGQDSTAQAQLTAAGITYLPAGNLPEGNHTAVVKIADLAGNPVELIWQFTTDTIAPVPAITSQADGQYLNTPVITVSGTLDDSTAMVTVNGIAAVVTAQSFSLAGVTLAEGENTLIVVATDPAGNSGSHQIVIYLDTLAPRVTIAAPLTGFLTNVAAVDVTGSVNEPVLSVSVNGLPASLIGQQFSRAALALTEGANTIEATAVDRAGNVGTAKIYGTLDTLPPAAPVLDQPMSPRNTAKITLSGSAETQAMVEIFAQSPGIGIDALVPVGNVHADSSGRFILPPVSLAEGVTGFTATTTDAAGNKSGHSVIVSVHLDTINPVITAHAPTDGLLLNNSRPSIATSFADEQQGSGLNLVSARMLLDGQDLTKQTQITSDSISYVPAANLPEGNHTVLVKIADLAHNPVQLSWQFTTDTIAPVPAITSQADGQYLNTPVITVSGTLDDSTATVTVNGIAAVVTAQSFSLAGVTLAEGENTLIVVATDPAGNSGSHQIVVHLDTVAPVVAIAAPLAGFLTNIAAVDVTGSVNEPVLSVSVNGLPATLNGEQFGRSALALAEGANTIEATAVDRAGNIGAANVNGTLDTLPPAAPVLVQPTSPTNITTLSVLGSAEALSTVKVFIQVPGAAAAVSPDTISADGSGSFTLSGINLAEGVTRFTATATDAVGNVSAVSTSVSIHLDTVAPAINAPAPANGSLLKDGRPALSASFTDEPQGSGLDLASVRLLLDDSDVTVQAQVGLVGIQYHPAADLPEGSHTAVVRIGDLAGNPVELSWQFATDTIPPVPAITSQSDGQYLNTPIITVAGTLDDPSAAVTINGVAAAITGQSFSLAGIALAEGANSLTVVATDPAGNAGSHQIVVHLDTVAPVVAIASPLTGFLTNVAAVDVTGSVNEPVLSVSVNGLPATLNGQQFGRSALALVEGANTIEATAVDRAGNIGTVSVNGTLDSIAPAAPVLVQPTSPTNIASTILSGNAEATSAIRLFSRAPDAASSILLATVGVDAAGAFVLPEILLAEGTTAFTATATDAAGNESALSVPVSVLLDTVAPTITITAPADHAMSEALDIRVTGALSEVAALTLDGVAVTLEGTVFDHPVTLVPGVNTLILLAIDAAGNTGTASVTIHADNTPPTVTLTAPLDGTLTRIAQIAVTGSIDEEGVTVTLNGQPLPLTGLNFSTPYTLSEGENTLTVDAVDVAGNIGSAVVGVILDSQPPQLTLTAPTEGTAGRNVDLTLDAADGRGLTLLELRAGGLVIWSGSLDGATSASRTVSYTLAPTLAQGTRVELQARTLDRAGNEGSATAQILVADAAAGPGYLQGEVYDDRSGLRLAGADVAVFAATGQTSGQTSDAGAYFAELPAGEYLVHLSKPGHTTVERYMSLRPEQNAAALDARLTPTGTGSVKVPVPLINDFKVPVPLADGAVIELTLPVESLTEEIDLRLTPVSNQGLAGLLPAGWSPLAVLDLRALQPVSGELLSTPPIFAEPAALSIPLPEGVEAALAPDLVLARYDDSRHQWIAVSTVAIEAEKRLANSALTAFGQYALVAPDPAPLAPPASDSGQPLAAAIGGSAPDFTTLSAAGRVLPAASPPLKNLIAVGEVVLGSEAGTDDLASGTVVNARINERFDLASGEIVQPAEYVQDLVLYRYPCATNLRLGVAGETAAEGSLRTTFPVSPSREYGFVDLQLGKVGVEIWPGEQSVSEGLMVGPDGARLMTEAGDTLEILAGALARTTPVVLRPATAGAAGSLGNDFLLLRAVTVELTGQTLAASARLSIPLPAGFDPARPIVLARVIEIGGVQRLKLVGFGQVSGSMLVSTTNMTAANGAAVSGAGITISGTYAFLQAKATIGFVAGRVNAGGAPFAGARVSVANATLVDSTSGDGRYLLALPVAAATVIALDPVKWDQGEGSVPLQSAYQLIAFDLAIQATPPRLLGIEPANNAVGIEASEVLRFTFSEPIDRATINDQTIVLKDAAGAVIPGVFSFTPDGAVVSFYPAAALKSETRHTLAVGTGIRDLQGYPLAQAVTSAFTTRDTTPPPPPPAGAITASFPDTNGMITVTATQGSAEAGCTVLVINDNTGEIVAVTPQTNGSFTARISAQLGDEIQVVLMDAAGNQTLISYLTFKAPDGRYLVTARGGKVEGEGGLLLDIPEGALLGPAVVKITPVVESALPHPVPVEGKFLAAVNIDTGGVRFQKEVKLSVPAPANTPAQGFNFVTQPRVHVNPDGSEEKVYVVIDSTKTIDGRLTCNSPPFDGIFGFGMFAFIGFMSDNVGFASGTTYRDMNGDNIYTPGTDLPVKGAVIRCPAAENFISYSGSTGHYAATVVSPAGYCASSVLTAMHPLTMQRASRVASSCQVGTSNLNLKLAEKGTIVPDTTPPVVSIRLQVVPGQAGNPRLIADTVPVGTKIDVSLSIIDQAIETVFLTALLKDENGEQSIFVQAGVVDTTIYRPMEGEEIPALFRFTYQPKFGTQLGTGSIFQPTAPGFYTLTVEAKDEGGYTTRQIRQIRVVTPGAIPAGIEGPPFVLSIMPGGDSIKIDTSVRAVFSEMVDNVTESTFQLIDTVTGQPVPAIVSVGVEEGMAQAVLLPRGNLHFGRRYEIVVTQGITDSGGNQFEEGQLPLAAEVRTFFTTQSPQAYTLFGEDPFKGSRDIDLYTAKDGRTFAYVTAGDFGWRVIDVTDPTRPAVVYTVPGSTYWNYRGVAVEQETGTMGMTINVNNSSSQLGLIYFYNLAADPVKPPLIGRELLASGNSGIPGRLDLENNYAYIATTGAGVQVVDIGQATADPGAPSRGQNIVGGYDTINQGFGHPNDILIYGANRAIVTTNPGYLLLLDLTMPQLPMLVSAFKPDGVSFSRLGVATDYSYEDANSAIQVIDLVVTGTYDGKLRTIDITDPANPRLLGVATDDSGNEVITWASRIAINQSHGLAFVSSSIKIQIFDIKDPAHPRLLSTLAELPDENGGIVPLGSTFGLVVHDGWVYMTSEAKGMSTLSLSSKFGTTIKCGPCAGIR